MKATRIVNYLRSGFSLFWMSTFEPNRVRENIYEMIKSYERKDGNQYKIIDWTMAKEANPLKALQELTAADPFTILFAHNFHWFSDKPPIVQYIQDMIPQWQAQGKAFVSVSPVEKIPVELSKDFVLMEFNLPDKDEIITSIHRVMPDDSEIPNKEVDQIVDSCRGLTRAEVEATLSLAWVEMEGKGFDIQTINEYKAQAIMKTGFLEVLQPIVTFADVIGYGNIKQFVLDTINNPKAKGIMTIGPPGCCKTTLMKAIVAETGKFGLSVSMGNLFSKFQGETDQRVKQTIDLIRSIGPCLVLIDEFEKQFAGSGSDGSLDSGTTKRATSKWLDFLQDRPDGVYIVGTANSFVGIPPEYLRPGRWDSSPFFLDLPTDRMKRKILEHYCKKADIKIPKKAYNLLLMDKYSGAEVEALVHIASMRSISLYEAEKCVIATAKTSEDSITALREWAKDRTIPAEAVPGLKAINGGKRNLDV